jgi:hypothetical protein
MKDIDAIKLRYRRSVPGRLRTPLWQDVCEDVDALLAEVERLQGERDHFREAWAKAQVRIDCGSDATEAIREERAAAVAWLRGDAGFRMVPGNMPYCDYYADAIERGEHLGGAVKREDGPAHVTIPGHPTDICRHGVPRGFCGEAVDVFGMPCPAKVAP